MGAGTSVKLVIPSEIRLIDLVHSASEKMAELAGFDADEALNVGLAVREGTINAIVHGNRQDPSLSCEVTLTANDDGLEARITAEGDGFDPDAAPDPTQGDALMATTGRGLLLIRAFVDDVEYKPRDTGGMVLILTKQRKVASDKK